MTCTAAQGELEAESSGGHEAERILHCELEKTPSPSGVEWRSVKERRRCSKVGTRVVIMRCPPQEVGDEDDADMG